MILLNCRIGKKIQNIQIKKDRIKSINVIPKSLKFDDRFDFKGKRIIQSAVAFLDLDHQPTPNEVRSLTRHLLFRGFGAVIIGYQFTSAGTINKFAQTFKTSSFIDFGFRNLSKKFDSDRLLFSRSERSRILNPIVSNCTSEDLMQYFSQNRKILFEEVPIAHLLTTSSRSDVSNLISLEDVLNHLDLLGWSPFGMIKLNSITDAYLLEKLLQKVEKDDLEATTPLLNRNFARFFDKSDYLFGELANLIILDETNKIEGVIFRGQFGTSVNAGGRIRFIRPRR